MAREMKKLRYTRPVAMLLAAALAGAMSMASADSSELSLSAQVGKLMFFDKNLSASGKMACSTCHDPNYAYAPPNSLAVQPGGPNMNVAGTRAVPSLRYKDNTPPYSDLFDNPDGISAPGPGGGFTQDGRAPTLADQAQIPLLAANEMANTSTADVVTKIQKSTYATLFQQTFGDAVFDNPQKAFAFAMKALQAYQLEDVSFHPYTSKYDLYAANKIGGDLTASEARGLAVFSDPDKGNCFACHYSGAGQNGSVALFTDFSYAAIGVPRNTKDIPANVLVRGLPTWYDLGICNRPDHPVAANAQYCGMFKTPTLRNVATRKAFFHNGQFKQLADVIRFYNTRDTNPELWYPTVNGVVQKFDDLPTKYRGNIDSQMPLDGRPRGSQPAMTEQDMADLLAFLGTLTDGYKPGQ
jgi:cytochrome c peroxidase